MKKFKKVSAVVLSSVMVFSIAGCGKNVSGVSAEAQESKVAEASIKMKEAKSMKGNMQMDVKMSAEGETMDMTSVSDMVMFNDPLKMKMDMTTEVMGEKMTMQYYMQKNDNGTVDMYYGSDDLGWMKQNVDMSYVEELNGNADYYLKYAEDFESAGEEEINGETTEKFVGVIKAEDINEVFENTNLDSLITSTGGDISDVKKIFEGLEDIPMTIWISNESGYPVQYDMDMTQLMQIVMDNTMAQYAEASGEEIPEITIENVKMLMNYGDFNEVDDFEVPADIIENAVEFNVQQ